MTKPVNKRSFSSSERRRKFHFWKDNLKNKNPSTKTQQAVSPTYDLDAASSSVPKPTTLPEHSGAGGSAVPSHPCGTGPPGQRGRRDAPAPGAPAGPAARPPLPARLRTHPCPRHSGTAPERGAPRSPPPRPRGCPSDLCRLGRGAARREGPSPLCPRRAAAAGRAWAATWLRHRPAAPRRAGDGRRSPGAEQRCPRRTRSRSRNSSSSSTGPAQTRDVLLSAGREEPAPARLPREAEPPHGRKEAPRVFLSLVECYGVYRGRGVAQQCRARPRLKKRR